MHTATSAISRRRTRQHHPRFSRPGPPTGIARRPVRRPRTDPIPRPEHVTSEPDNRGCQRHMLAVGAGRDGRVATSATTVSTGRRRGVAEHQPAEDLERVLARPVAHERRARSMRVPAVVLDADLEVGVREVEAIRSAVDDDAVLLDRAREAPRSTIQRTSWASIGDSPGSKPGSRASRIARITVLRRRPRCARSRKTILSRRSVTCLRRNASSTAFSTCHGGQHPVRSQSVRAGDVTGIELRRVTCQPSRMNESCTVTPGNARSPARRRRDLERVFAVDARERPQPRRGPERRDGPGPRAQACRERVPAPRSSARHDAEHAGTASDSTLVPRSSVVLELVARQVDGLQRLRRVVHESVLASSASGRTCATPRASVGIDPSSVRACDVVSGYVRFGCHMLG